LLKEVFSQGISDGYSLEGLRSIAKLEGDMGLTRELSERLLNSTDAPVPARLNAMQFLAEAYRYENRMDEAAVMLEKMTRLRRAADDWRLLADCYSNVGRSEDALHAANRAVRINPFDWRNQAVESESLRIAGRFAEANVRAEKARLLRRP
jgi:tetratricopeptide (TPR) repeat protein